MVDEREPAKRVVKKVVKKTVVRPAPNSSTQPTQPAPQMRYGRPVPTAAKPQAKAESKTSTKQAGPVTRTAPRPQQAPRTKPPRQPVDVRAKVTSAGQRVGDAWWAVADPVAGGTRTSGRFLAGRARAVAAWRLPHINLYLAAVITGAISGLLSVGLGIGALRLFEQIRGVSAGGGFWGGLAFIGVALVAVLVGQLLLAAFGSHAARLTSFLAVVLAVVAMLGRFIDRADSAAGLIIVPVLGIVSHVVAHWLIDLAENTPALVE